MDYYHKLFILNFSGKLQVHEKMPRKKSDDNIKKSPRTKTPTKPKATPKSKSTPKSKTPAKAVKPKAKGR